MGEALLGFTRFSLKLPEGGGALFQPVDFEISRKRVVLIRGENAVGKTKLLEWVAGEDDAKGWRHEGEVRCTSRSVTGGKELGFGCAQDLFNIWFSPSNWSLFEDLTVREHLLVAVPMRRGVSPESEMSKSLDDAGLLDVSGHRVGELSGGQQRRLQFTLARFMDSEVVFLDEPLAGLDDMAVDHVLEEIERDCLAGTAFVIAEQRVSEFVGLPFVDEVELCTF